MRDRHPVLSCGTGGGPRLVPVGRTDLVEGRPPMPDHPAAPRQPENPESVLLRARDLIEADDPRIHEVEEALAPELSRETSPDRLHYLAALAVAAVDARRGDRRAERGWAYHAATAVVAVMFLVLGVSMVAAVVAGVFALWKAVL
ncbi:hypothetical protein CUT44_21535 [Streptomyces carminius]|uniref:Uncharacterized protein n=1 Tax=Streptomyces carminius TaxID=2665496 RepID=A0A2M8LV73_9ACTN|nr:hypothetical protein [Streptomyces carminius]PJE95835.1 hypothetical protein CUT44_21535 [Streptomyces carminius]